MIFFGSALVFTGIFLIQFILSFIVGELDTDIDIDGDGFGDFSLSDIFSFKGLIHFGIGFSWTMYFSETGGVNIWTAIFYAFLVGLSFVLILWFVYSLVMRLKNEICREEGEDLIGRTVTIYLSYPNSNKYSGYVEINGRAQLIYNIASIGDKEYSAGDTSEICKYENGIYYIN